MLRPEHFERAVDELAGLRAAGERIASALESLASGWSTTTQRAGKGSRRRSGRAVVVPKGVEVDDVAVARARKALRDLGLRKL